MTLDYADALVVLAAVFFVVGFWRLLGMSEDAIAAFVVSLSLFIAWGLVQVVVRLAEWSGW